MPPEAPSPDADAPAPDAYRAPAPGAPVSPDPLAPAIAAIERGDHREARRLAAPLREHADPELRARARALLTQLAPDPVVVAVMLGTGALIAVLAALFLGTH